MIWDLYISIPIDIETKLYSFLWMVIEIIFSPRVVLNFLGFPEDHALEHSPSRIILFTFRNRVMLVQFGHYRVKIKPLQKLRCTSTMFRSSIYKLFSIFFIFIGQTDDFVPIGF